MSIMDFLLRTDTHNVALRLEYTTQLSETEQVFKYKVHLSML